MRVRILGITSALLVAPLIVSAAQISFSGSANDGEGAIISVSGTIDDVADSPNLKFTLQVDGDAGDIRGFFFDVMGDVDDLFGGLDFTGPDVTEVQVAEGAVSDLGNGANVNPDAFDVGVEIGTQGASPDFISMTMFSDNNTLSLSDLYGQSWGFRAMSTGPGMEGSVKITGTFPNEQDQPGDVPEPSTYLLFGAGLVAMGYLKRRQANKS